MFAEHQRTALKPLGKGLFAVVVPRACVDEHGNGRVVRSRNENHGFV